MHSYDQIIHVISVSISTNAFIVFYWFGFSILTSPKRRTIINIIKMIEFNIPIHMLDYKNKQYKIQKH